MKNRIRWVTLAFIVAVVVLQVLILGKLEGLKPFPSSSDGEDVRIPSLQEIKQLVPSLQEIDLRIQHWTMHHGATFSAKSEVSTLKRDMDKRLQNIEKKLDALEQASK